MNRIIQHLRRGALLFDGEGLTDGQLLEAYLSRREESAFEALVCRHGRLVLGVCRRILGNAADAEDAFQATFLVLVRKAGSLRSRDLLANWLYGVAHRTALKARALSARRRAVEGRLRVMPEPVEAPDHAGRELLPLLDRELTRLPDKYRVPVILCDLQGKGRKEAASQLGVPEGTLSSRLATARKRLARRLGGHGLAVAGGALGSVMGADAASARVPASLLAATTRAAGLFAAGNGAAVSGTVAALTGGVLKTMFLSKLKTTVVLLGVAGLGLGTGRVLYQARAGAADATTQVRRQRTDPASANRPARAEGQEPDGAGGRDAEQARDGERDLREELARARKEAAALRLELDAVRRKAEAERRRAEEVLSRMARAGTARRDGQRQVTKRDLDELDALAARVDREHEMTRQALLEQLKALEVKRRKELEELKRRRAMLLREPGSPGQPAGGGPAPASGDKLDRVLQHLEQLEKRINRLERAR